MQELNFINTYLGGHAITISGLKQLAGKQSSLSICEIGCGGGDNLLAIQKWCARKGIQTTLTGIDINPFCIEVARQQLAGLNHQLIVSDYRDARLPEQPDIIFSSLFCHHFTDEA